MAGFNDYLAGMDDYMGDDLIGALPRRAAMRRPVALAATTRTAAPAARALAPVMPGVPKSGPRLEPLGFPLVTFTNTSGTTLTSTTRPQRPFKGGRPVIVVARSVATLLQLVQITSLFVGGDNVLGNANPIAAEVFAATAFGVELQISEVTPGIDIVATFSLVGAALGAGETINVQTTLIGMSYRG